MLAEIKAEQKGRSKYGQTSFSAFKDKYLDWAAANKAVKTINRDQLSLEYIEEFKPIKDLAEITPALLDDFKTWLKNRTEKTRPKGRKKQPRLRGVMTNWGINRTISSIKAIMGRAEKWGMVEKQNWAAVSKLKTPKGRVEFFTADEISRLLEYAHTLAAEFPIGKQPPWETVIMLGARAGLRRAEMHNLMWKDINFEKGILSVTPKKDWAPKDYECRDVAMCDDLRNYLQHLPHRGQYVIYDRYGERLSLDSYTTYFRDKIVKKCGLTGNVHKLRHTFASHLVQAGVDLYTVSKLLGHSTIQTTEIYAHLSPITLANAVSRLPDVVKNVVKK